MTHIFIEIQKNTLKKSSRSSSCTMSTFCIHDWNLKESKQKQQLHQMRATCSTCSSRGAAAQSSHSKRRASCKKGHSSLKFESAKVEKGLIRRQQQHTTTTTHLNPARAAIFNCQHEAIKRFRSAPASRLPLHRPRRLAIHERGSQATSSPAQASDAGEAKNETIQSEKNVPCQSNALPSCRVITSLRQRTFSSS